MNQPTPPDLLDPKPFPRYFINPKGFDTDAMIVKFTAPTVYTVINRNGLERPGRHQEVTLLVALEMVTEGRAKEITQAEADEMQRKALAGPDVDESNRIAQRIYAEWKWNLKKGSWTYGTLSKSIEEVIEQCKRDIPHPIVQSMVVARFSEALSRLSEFTVDDDADPSAIFGDEIDSATPADVAGWCVVCRREVKSYEPHEQNPAGGIICADCQIKMG